MSKSILKVENLSKRYKLGQFGTGTLSHDINRWFNKKFRGIDPYSIVGDENDRTKVSKTGYVWALQDISFEVKRGEVLGIIGANGAGKSTLLKILSKVTTPSTGKVYNNGRIASLLEVGTGFHPELTGVENIYLNGAILGMSKKEIKSKIEEIIEFAGIRKFLDTPIKRYSSGMKVRLGFAVAAFLEPEILIVDEVLAVGDADFQEKAIGKMKSVSSEQGRTVLFVSHNLNTISSLCDRAILLKNGRVESSGQTDEIIDLYLRKGESMNSSRNWVEPNRPGSSLIKLNEARLLNSSNELISNSAIESDFFVEFSVQILDKVLNPLPQIHIRDEKGELVFISYCNNYSTLFEQKKAGKGDYKFKVHFPKNIFNTGTYYFDIGFVEIQTRKIHFYEKQVIALRLFENAKNRGFLYAGQIKGVMRPKLNWEVT